MRQPRRRIKGRKSEFGEKQKTGRTSKDAICKKRIRGGTKLEITDTSDTLEVDPSRDSASEQKNKIGVTSRGDQKICTICKLCSNGSGHGMPLSI